MVLTQGNCQRSTYIKHVHSRGEEGHTQKPLQTLNMNQAAAVDMYDLPNVGNGKFTR